MAKLIGTKPEQVPTNADLGTMAYQDKDNVNVGGGQINGAVIGGSTPSAITGTTVTASTGLLELDGNDIGGTQVTIADDAVASITPPRKGGFMFVSAGLTGGDYPQQSRSGMVFFDAGSSLEIQERITASALDVSTSDVTGTTGTDGNVTIAVQSGVLKIENRGGNTHVFDVTFL